MPFEQFPWFKSATVEQITNVERPSPEHLYWPNLDVDLAVQSIRQPEAFPLIALLLLAIFVGEHIAANFFYDAPKPEEQKLAGGA